jgi:hypothetical protein
VVLSKGGMSWKVLPLDTGALGYIEVIKISSLTQCNLKQNTVRSESLCALRLRYVDLVVSIEVAGEVC